MMMSSWEIVVMLWATLASSGFCQDCSSDPCLQGAPCVNAALGYYCQCPVLPVSTSEIVYTGQNCDESLIGFAGCNMNYYDSEGNITSPGYPNDYENRQECYSHLKIANATQITLILEEFDLEPPTKDALIFGKGPKIYEVDPMHPDIYELGGNLASLPLSERTYVFNDTNQIFFYFFSDKNVVHPGYRISYTADIDSCMPGPCLNDATCMDEYYDYSCICAPGYEGRNCEDDIDECGSQPCQNKGTCADGTNMYTCTCAAGYTGDHCETDINECSSNPCENEGTCTDQIAMYTCTCVAGYEGDECQININECMSTPCQNGGLCADGVNLYACFCTGTGFDGTHCQNNIDECASDPCFNGGTCDDGINEFSCQCAPGWTDIMCQTNIDECASGPCQNGGTCVDEVNGYTCMCPVGTKGTNCETLVDACMSDPCANGSTCVNSRADFICVCAPGFEGDLCDLVPGPYYAVSSTVINLNMNINHEDSLN